MEKDKTNKKELLSAGDKVAKVALAAIKKKYGSVITPLSKGCGEIKTVSTGSLGLDLALGRGGMALGRVYEIFGPNSGGKSTLGVHVIIQGQRRGMKCAYLDAEMAVDPVLFTNYGVDAKKLDLVQVYGGEPNLDILERLIRTGIYDIIVVDSVSALIPMSEAEADIDKDQMALQARLMSKALRKITPIAAENKTLLIFINQLRMKLGSYGCFHGDTLVNFVNGESIPIRKVVDEKIKGNVFSLNESTGDIEEKPIVNWYDNGEVETDTDFIYIQTSSVSDKDKIDFTCTPVHKLYTKDGWRKAKELSIGDKLVSKYTQTINGTYGDFLLGVLVGDSYISIKYKNTGSLKLQDNENRAYIKWKLDKLSNFIEFNECDVAKGYEYSSNYMYEFAKIKKTIGDRYITYFLDNYTDLGFAVWMMDNGSLDLNNGHRRYGVSIKRIKNDFKKCEEVKNKLIELGFDCNYFLDSGFFQFETHITNKIAATICNYVPQCMEYKLPVKYRGRYKEFTLENCPTIVKDFVEVKEIRKASKHQMRKKRKFDISVEGNNNYMVGGKSNGIIAHNSPQTTTGGGALAFWATGRISVRGPESKARRLINDEGDVYGHVALHEVVKNKLGEPFKKANLNLIYGKGYDVYNEILELAVSLNIIEKAGSWFKYNNENIAQGVVNSVEVLKKDTKLFNTIRDSIFDIVGLKEQYELHSNPGPLYSNEVVSSESV